MEFVRSIGWRRLAGLGYVLVLWLWFAEGYRLLPGPRALDTDAGGTVINLVTPVLVGLVVRRWWAVLLPGAALLIALPLQLAGATGRGYDPLEPFAAAVVISLLFGLPATVVGVGVGQVAHKLIGRRSSSAPT